MNTSHISSNNTPHMPSFPTSHMPSIPTSHMPSPPQSILPFIPCYHTSDIYKHYMIIVGGISLKGFNNKRKFNSDICVYNFIKK